MKQSSRPNIVEFYDMVWTEGNDKVWIIMEYMDGGSVKDLMNYHVVFREDHISTICWEVSIHNGIMSTADTKQTAKAFPYLHGHCITFRDIKSDNISLDRSGNTKLCKAGLSFI